MPEICQGCAIYVGIPSPSSQHLFFIMTQPHGEPPIVVMVNISTVRGYRMEDPTVILHPGDHSFIKHDSYVGYGFTRKIRLSVLEKHLEDGKAEMMDPVAEHIFQRVFDGLLQSPHTPQEMKAICRRAK